MKHLRCLSGDSPNFAYAHVSVLTRTALFGDVAVQIFWRHPLSCILKPTDLAHSLSTMRLPLLFGIALSCCSVLAGRECDDGEYVDSRNRCEGKCLRAASDSMLCQKMPLSKH